MKKAEFISAIAEKGGFSKAAVKDILKVMAEVIMENIGVEGGVPIIDGLKVGCVERASRKARNPATGELVTVKAKKYPRAKFGKIMKDAAAAAQIM